MRVASDQIQSYVESLIPTQSSELKKIAEELKKDNKWGINIGSVEGALLHFFIKTYQVNRILEIGTQYGYSTQWMLEALPENGKIVTLEKDPAHFEKAKSLVVDQRVEFFVGDALEILPMLQKQEPFDLVFVDANKKAYPEYLNWAMKLTKKGSLIIGDNTFLFGSALMEAPPEDVNPGMWKAMRSFNKSIFSNDLLTSCIIPTGEGMTVAMRK